MSVPNPDKVGSGVEFSLVIPVYNGSTTVAGLVQQIHGVFSGVSLEVILVNDGSGDASEQTCVALVDRYPGSVTLVQLSRNFGEHNAVLAGLSRAVGDYVAILDDDGQNPPEEVVRLLAELKAKRYDVVYGRYRVKHHSVWRNLASWMANRMANVMLRKPAHIYLSSFKVMNRFLVDEVTKYHGAFPYIDGLIFRTTRNIGQIDVEHRDRLHGRSTYTLTKLVGVWMNMFLNFSILPLRVAQWIGLGTSLGSVLILALIWIDKLYSEPGPRPGIPTVLCLITFFGGINLLIAGMLGEYLGRLYLDHTGTPQYVVRYVRSRHGAPPESSECVADPGFATRLEDRHTNTPRDGIPTVAGQVVRQPDRSVSRSSDSPDPKWDETILRS